MMVLDWGIYVLGKTEADGISDGLVLAGGQIATAEQIDTMISSAILTAEKYYPAFQLVVYDDQSPENAMQVAIAEAYGHA